MRIAAPLALILLLSVAPPAAAQPLASDRAGPAIEGFGAVYEVPDPDFPTATDRLHRAVFDVSLGAGDPAQLNPRIETLARFLNMHAQAGVPLENMKLALVLHGTAGKDALGDEGFRERFGVANPNRPLIEALLEYGVRVVLCGQTQVHRGLGRHELLEGVDLALSAMTVLIDLQSRGYALVAF